MLIKKRFNEAGALCGKLVRIRVLFLQGAFIMLAGMREEGADQIPAQPWKLSAADAWCTCVFPCLTSELARKSLASGSVGKDQVFNFCVGRGKKNPSFFF